MALNKVVRKKLVETKVAKENQLIESKIINSRLSMVIGNLTKEKYERLTEKEQGKIAVLYLMELGQLSNEGLISEQFNLIDSIKGIFGSGIWGGSEALVEKALNSILTGIGIPDSNVKKFLVSFFATNPSELVKAFSSCSKFVTHVARAIMETMVMNLQQTKGFGGMGWDIVRNVLQNQLQKVEFIEDIEKGISSKVCELFGSFTKNANDLVDKLKPTLAQVKTA
jgi:hypothetical protein